MTNFKRLHETSRYIDRCDSCNLGMEGDRGVLEERKEILGKAVVFYKCGLGKSSKECKVPSRFEYKPM